MWTVWWTGALNVVVAAALAQGFPAGPWVAALEPEPRVLRAFERPADRFAAGHRGVDWPASPGQSVLAIGAGTVSHVGQVAGVPSITVDHGIVRSSYLPVKSPLVLGDRVAAGDRLGEVTSASHCPTTCLHLGLRLESWEAFDATRDPYLDPLAWLRRVPVLKPLTAPESN